MTDGISLDGIWDFAFFEGKSIEDLLPEIKAASPRGKLLVPSCFDLEEGLMGKRGTALYKKTFFLEQELESPLLVIDGMGLRGYFEIDGKPLGTYSLPYSKIEIHTGKLARGRHSIAALSDNRFDREKIPLAQPYYDFYLYGGFYHGVSIAPHDKKIRIRTLDYSIGMIGIECVNFGSPPFRCNVSFDGNDGQDILLTEPECTLCVPGFKLWSPENPNLHSVTLRHGKMCITETFGIREISSKDRKLFLNGKEIFLRGVNRHEAHPSFGAATPVELMHSDLKRIKNLGCNFVRGAHYPQSQKFLDLCDRLGILVWEESLGFGNGFHDGIDDFALAKFEEDQISQTKLMVENSFNHPSVIIFGFMNEFESGREEGKILCDKLIETIKKANSGRLVTFACCFSDADKSNENTDIVSFNTYPGWIGSDAGDSAETERIIRDEVARLVKLHRNRHPGKPIIISEMGTCGIYGFRDDAAAQWSENFQNEYVSDILGAVLEQNCSTVRSNISGIVLWQLNDSKSFLRKGSTIRTKPLGENLAGIFDGYRRPKLVRDTIKKHYLDN